ncbi:hypothetical protein LTR56_013896 [Elasticomyces elasticus]|nr:hypothetical protein LTR56_013896 [Elasticomyces elasticus]KAK3656235.1 hypothetical protein LTR22_009808 [Elasticomyces elasticus]KAK4924524.1 hypothetical protein LTR49_008414 [Elasticomyces elasticus]KAK5761723.1 hypothetical protein LTS12_008156 [Elasticomyces elasticus]
MTYDSLSPSPSFYNITRYERVAADDNDDAITQSPTAIPSSPPPSFRSRASSRRTSREEQHRSEEERNLDDAFDAPSDDEDDDARPHDQRRLMSGEHAVSSNEEAAEETSEAQRPAPGQRRVTEIPVFAPSATTGRVVGNTQSNDGVFANITAKPRVGEDLEEKPPTYEQAAADATPPYWETTVLSPYATTGNPDDVFVDGLLVGSLFSFVWNALISMSFQLIGFLLTYLLHTTHAAKHGSRAGLGITLVQYGFQMRYSSSSGSADPGVPPAPVDGVPQDPNAHDFDPNQVGGVGGPADAHQGFTTTDILSYVLMIVGWFILIRSVSDFMRARRQEQLVRSSPDRGLGVAVVAEGEQPETSV